MLKGNTGIFIFLLFLVLVIDGNSQESALLRGEIDAKEYDFIYFVPVEKSGLLTIQHRTKYRSSKDFWTLNRYSRELELKNVMSFQTGPGYKLVEYDLDNDSLFYGFFAEKGGSRKYNVLKYNYKNDKKSLTLAVSDGHTSYEHFDVLDKAYFVAGIHNAPGIAYVGQALFSLTLVPAFTGIKIYNTYPKIFYNSGRINKNITIDLKGESVITDAVSNSEGTMYSLIVKNIYRKKSALHYYGFDNKGQQIVHTVLTKLDRKNILSARLIPVNDGIFTFVGTYNEDRKHRLSSNKEATGIFVSTLNRGVEKIVRFHPFYDFNNVKKALGFSGLKRFEENKRKGKNTVLGFNLLMHKEIIKKDSLYLLLAESYYPEYHYELYNNFYGSLYNDQVFDGFRFTTAFVAAFDRKGDLVWDNTFDVSDIISYNLDENVIAYNDGTTTVLLYYYDGYIYSQVIEGNDVVFRKEKTTVETVGRHEKVVYESYGKIYHWYDNYFLLTGFQVVAGRDGKKRKVYFFLKIGFE